MAKSKKIIVRASSSRTAIDANGRKFSYITYSDGVKPLVCYPARLQPGHNVPWEHEVQAALNADNTLYDKRYRIQQEYGGRALGTKWVARFCDEYCGYADTQEEARAIANKHTQQRMSNTINLYATIGRK